MGTQPTIEKDYFQAVWPNNIFFCVGESPLILPTHRSPLSQTNRCRAKQFSESTGSSDSPGGTRRDTGCVTQPPAPRGSRGLPDLPVFHFFFLMRLHLAFVILMNLLGSCNSWSWRGACSDRNKSNLATVKHISGDSTNNRKIDIIPLKYFKIKVSYSVRVISIYLHIFPTK